jgi:hypothetical protein
LPAIVAPSSGVSMRRTSIPSSACDAYSAATDFSWTGRTRDTSSTQTNLAKW